MQHKADVLDISSNKKRVIKEVKIKPNKILFSAATSATNRVAIHKPDTASSFKLSSL